MNDEQNQGNEELDIEIEESEELSGDAVKKLRERLRESEDKNKENMEGWQRARADYANLQKTHGEQLKNLKHYVMSGVVEDLLPVLDSFSMAMSNKEVWEKVDANWRMGIEYILKQLNEALEKNGVTEIETKEGDMFDPEKHQALETVETDDEGKSGTLAGVMQKGYKMGDDVLRPVKVRTFALKNKE
jgi:molecular chaperone GrpE